VILFIYKGDLFIPSFICSLFNDAFSITQTIQHEMKGRYMNDKLERMWKETVVG
jgi:hypothetical protein